MRISTIVPVHNADRYIAEALTSIFAQSHPVDRVIVVDDGSSDASLSVVERFVEPLEVVRQPHSGAAAARNAGLQRTDDDCIAFLDADDRWTPDKIMQQIEYLERHSEVAGVLGMVQQFHSPELTAAETARLWCPPEPQPGYLTGALLVRRWAFDRVGLFDTTLSVGEFVGWFARASDCGLRFACLPSVVLHRRLHGASLSIRERGSKDYVRMLKSVLDRRRGLSPPA